MDEPDTIHCKQRQQACFAELFGYVVAQSMRAKFRQVFVSANKTRNVWNGGNSPSASLVKHSYNFGNAAEIGRGLHGRMRLLHPLRVSDSLSSLKGSGGVCTYSTKLRWRFVVIQPLGYIFEKSCWTRGQLSEFGIILGCLLHSIRPSN